MDMEESSSADNIPDLIFIMAMFNIELCKHGIKPWCIPIHVDDVRGHISTAALEFINLFRVSAQNLFGRGIWKNAGHWFPPFVINTNTCENVSNLIMFLQRSIFVRDAKDSHDSLTPVDQRQGHTAYVMVRIESALPSETPKFQYCAWLLASSHPRYKTHVDE